MGKPIGAARDEVRKCAAGCRYYAENGERFLEEERSRRGRAQFCPLGAAWRRARDHALEFSFLAGLSLCRAGTDGRQCRPAQTRGKCSAVCARDRGYSAARRSGGRVFQTLLIGSERVAALIADRRVAAVTLTGSDRAGSEVAAAAGRAIKKCVLELGGSDPFIVMPSADLDAAVTTRGESAHRQ